MRRSDDAGGAATVEGDSARGGAGMNEDGRGRSPDASQAATGPVSGEMRRRGRRVRVVAGFAAAGAFAGFATTGAFAGLAATGAFAGLAATGNFAGGGATAIGFFAVSGFFATASLGRAAGLTGFTADLFVTALRGGAAFFFAGRGAETFFNGLACFTAGFGRAIGLVVFFEDFAADFSAAFAGLGAGFVRGVARRGAAEAAFFLEAAGTLPAFLPFAIGIAIPLRPLQIYFEV